MKNRWVGILISVATLFAMATAYAAPSLSASYSLSDETPKAGSTVFYYVTVRNAGTSAAEDIEVRIINMESTFGGTRGPGLIKLGDIAAGDSETASFAIYLRDDQFGVRRINTEITYEYDGVENTIEYDQYFTVESTQLQVMETSSSTTPLKPSEIGKLEIKLANQQNEGASRFKFDFTSGVSGTTTVFKVLGSSTQYIDKSIKEGESITVSYELYVDKSIPSGVYDATLSIEYIGGGVEKTETLELGIRVQGDLNLDIGTVQTDPREIKEGDEDVKVTIGVQNIGDEQVKNLKVGFRPKEPFGLTPSTQETQNLGILDTSSSASAVFYLDVTDKAEAGRYEIPVTLEYLDVNGNSHTEAENITLGIKATPIISIREARTVPDAIAQGDLVSLYIIVVNSGSKDADGISVRAIENIEQPFEYEEKSDNVGMLKPGEEGEAVLKFTVDQGATLKKYGVNIEVRYTDGDDVYTEEETINVDVSVMPESDTTLYLVMAALIIVIVVLGWKIKQRL
ncbi:MAG: COG1361 S-layer family protein [Candidatus Altiarchaeota archaeon]|nr:COG1361 S-layer family protein [Candidatus Altiarchaeota archaeon]